MSDQDIPSVEGARDDLRRLTGAECTVLYWLCKGLSVPEIAKKLTVTESAVRGPVTSIYRKFGFGEFSYDTRKYLLHKVYCPIHQQMVKDPERDCRRTRKPRTESPKGSDQRAHREDAEQPPSTGDEGADAGEESTEEPTTPPDPRILAIVKQDEEQGIIPLRRSIILRQQDLVPIELPGGEEQVNARPGLANLLPLLVAFLIGAVLIYAVMSGRSQQSGGTGAAPSAPQSTQQQQPSGGARPSATAVPAAISSVQSPAPGSVIAAGQAFTRGGVTVAARRQLEIDSGFIGVSFDIQNGSSNQIIVRWKPSFFHLEDDQGRIYHQRYEESVALNQVFQFSLAPSAAQTISAWMNGYGDHSYGSWVGQIDPNAKYLIFRVDDIAGLTNLTWRFDF